MQALEEAKDASELTALLRQKGMDVSEAEVEALLAESMNNAELDENQLDTVAGGGLLTAYAVVKTVIKLLTGTKSQSQGGGGSGALGGGGNMGGR